MKLRELLAGIADVPAEIDITGLELDSRQVKPGNVFVALAGSIQHGIQYAQQALDQGAVAVIFDPAGKGLKLAEKLPAEVLIEIPGLSEKLGELAAKFFHEPSRILDVIGITGTNGKTSCSQYLAQSMDDCAVIGTLGWGRLEALQETKNTTPDAVAIQKILYECVKQGLKTVFMEVSSHGLAQNRVKGVNFKGALFTNLSRDHLDYHGSMENYRAAKKKLLQWPGLKFAVLNLDDENKDELLQCLDPVVDKWGFSVRAVVDPLIHSVQATKIVHGLNGIQFEVVWRDQMRRVKTDLVGPFNLENVLAVITIMLAMGVSLKDAVKRIERLKPVDGRMEKFGGRLCPTVFVDYAHSPDALEKVLSGLRAQCQQKLRVVFGCGGDRDKGKRVQMGRVAEQWADDIVLTDDNPRSEPADEIVRDILMGCSREKTNVIHDRERAIRTMIKNAGEEDCIVIAGKGHENYQEIAGIRMPMSDRLIVKQALAEWNRSC